MINWKGWFKEKGITGIETDSRKVKPGDVFVVYEGVELRKALLY